MKVVSQPTKPESIISVKFQDNPDGSVTVKTESGWYLVTISQHGITLHSFVAPSLGFSLDEVQRLRVIKG